MKLKLNYILAFASSLILLFCLVFISSVYGHHFKFSFSILSYGFLTYLFFNGKYHKQQRTAIILLLLALPTLIILVPFHIRDFAHTLVSLPSTLAQLVGILLGYLCSCLGNRIRFVVIALSLAICYFATFYGYKLWLNKVNYGTFSGKTFEKAPYFELRDSGNKKVTSNDFQGKVTVLDFWITNCRPCFEGFPLLQETYEKYKQNKSIRVYAVNTLLNNQEASTPVNIFDSLNYTFPRLYASKNDVALLLGVSVYPTTIIINERQEVIFRGNLKEIDAILNEY